MAREQPRMATGVILDHLVEVERGCHRVGDSRGPGGTRATGPAGAAFDEPIATAAAAIDCEPVTDADGSRSEPTAAAQAEAPRRDARLVAVLVAAVAVPRVAVFPFAENLHGDAVARTEIAERWAGEPKLPRSFHDVRQFGPLHVVLAGAALAIWPDRERSPRAVSLVFGIAAAVPLFFLARRKFGRRAAAIAVLAFAAWPLHIQTSTTAGSEAVGLALLLAAVERLFAGLDGRKFAPLAASAAFLNLSCAVRYDAWLYVPLLAGLVAIRGSDRVAAATRAVLYAAMCAPFPLWWMQSNEVATGDPLYPIRYIERFHADWARREMTWLGEAGFRAYALLFAPGALLATLSPLVGAFALAGATVAVARRQRPALALLAAIPVAYYALRGAAFAAFAPLARFFIAQLALTLPYVEPGFACLVAGRSPAVRRALGALAVALSIATPAALGWATAWRDGPVAATLGPISPLSTLPTDQMEVARWIRDRAGPQDVLLVDDNPSYADLHVAFYSGLPDRRLVRRRWEDFEKRLAGTPPTLAVVFASGSLAATEGVSLKEGVLEVRGARYVEVFARPPGLRVFRRDE